MWNGNILAAVNNSCTDGFEFNRTNQSKSNPIFEIRSKSNKTIEITNFQVLGFNNEIIFEGKQSIIINPYSVKNFQPFFLTNPNLNEKVINNFTLSCKWYDKKNKDIKTRTTYLMCSNSFINEPHLPQSYEDYLNDINYYYAIDDNTISWGWDWKLGDFISKIPIKNQSEESTRAMSENFWDIKNDEYKLFLELNKYSLKMTVGIGKIDKNLFTKDEVKVKTYTSKCIEINANKLGKLKPRIN